MRVLVQRCDRAKVSVDNRVVRSFDTITYSFDILLADKEEIGSMGNTGMYW